MSKKFKARWNLMHNGKTYGEGTVIPEADISDEVMPALLDAGVLIEVEPQPVQEAAPVAPPKAEPVQEAAPVAPPKAEPAKKSKVVPKT